MKKKGFTFIEVLGVIVVLSVIFSIAIPIFIGVINKARLEGLKQDAYALVDASRLYYAQYQNDKTLRFDINNYVISSTDTNQLLKYKGSIKEGTIIVDRNGRSVICISDGKRSAYKNFTENSITLSENKSCSIPSGSSIVYLDNEATQSDYNISELTQKINELESRLNALESNVVPVGTIISYSTSSVPNGYLECNGQAVSRTTYAALFAKIGTTYGAGDESTTFNVPDLRGEFLRGYGTNSRTNQGSGATTVGTHQDATIMPRIYLYSSGIDFKIDSSSSSLQYSNADQKILTLNNQTQSYNVGRSSGWFENNAQDKAFTSRPTNTSVLYAIKY